ncbi:MAG TPA: glycosyltransferase family 2 protein [Brevibacterium sp.]|nr:glycosyltransferase family 2 protein [Brevibacterium sp.]
MESSTAYAVIIVNYGDPSLVAANIGADVDAELGALVVLVDNFHSRAARESAEALCRERGWLFVASANDGFGAGVNRGVKAARERGHHAFITLNPDAIAPAHVLRELARNVTIDPLALVSPFMDDEEGHPHYRGARVHRQTGRMRSGWSDDEADPEWANWLSGACLAFSARAFDLLGGFSEDFFLYWEDVDFSWRAADLGLRLELRPDLLVVHEEGGTQGPGGGRTKSPAYYYYNIRNRMLFGRRHLRGRDWARWVLVAPRQSALIWMRGGRKQAFTEPRGLLSAARGFLSGAAQLLRRAPSPTPRNPTPELSAPRPRADRSGQLRITIAIPTFKRPGQLSLLLEALPDRIAETSDAVVDVLVIDNDPDGSARDTVEGSGLGTGLRYVHERTPGISAARNRALDECRTSDLLAFLDDDEIPLDGWLASLVDVWRETGASAVAGRVISVFHENTDPWVIASGTFRRPQRPTGTVLATAAAGNLMLDMQQIHGHELRFEQSFGLSGGEDTLFTRQLVEQGGTIVWCNESAAEDYVVASRLTREWAAQRAYSAGNGWAHVNLRLAPGPAQRLAVRSRFLVGGTLRVTAGLARHHYGRARQHLTHDARGMRTFHRGRGMLAGASGHLYQEYARS